LLAFKKYITSYCNSSKIQYILFKEHPFVSLWSLTNLVLIIRITFVKLSERFQTVDIADA